MDKEEYKRLLNLRESQEMMFHKLLGLYCSPNNKVANPRDIIKWTGINEKRAIYLLSKFKDYNYGVSIDLGWIENNSIGGIYMNEDSDKSTKVVHFSYDPLRLTRMFLQTYVEKNIQGKDGYKSKQFACYDFLRDVSDQALDSIMDAFAKKEGIEFITFKGSEQDCKSIFEYIFDTQEYKDIESYYMRRGFGPSGHGVFDKRGNSFHPCNFAEHWSTVKTILKEKYPSRFDALEDFTYNRKLNESNGYERKEIDDFILNNFELCGEQSSLEYYLKR